MYLNTYSLNNSYNSINITHYIEYTQMPPKNYSIPTILYVIKGYTEILFLKDNSVVKGTTGSVLEIPANSVYAQRIKKNTSILLIKGSTCLENEDKPVSQSIIEWLSEGIVTTRTDHYNNPNAPEATTIIPAAAAVIVNDKNELLLLKRKDSGNWTMPGGTLEKNESISECIKREVFEETGLNTQIQDIIQIYSNPNAIVEYSDGEVRREFSVLYFVKIIDGDIRTDDESTDYGWFSLDKALKCQLALSQRQRINDAIEYIKRT